MKRPIGLTVFALLNFVWAYVTFRGFLGMLSFPFMLGEQFENSLNAYAILSPTLTTFILIVSGIGFLRLSDPSGFIGGLIFCIGSLADLLVRNALRGFEGFGVQVIGMIYPTVLLLFLIIRYRRVFLEQRVAER